MPPADPEGGLNGGRLPPRRLLWTALFLLFVALVFSGATFLFHRLKAEIPRRLSQALGTPVSYRTYHLSPLGYLEFTDFSGGPVRIESLRISFFLPWLILRREVRTIYARGIRVDLPPPPEKRRSPQAQLPLPPRPPDLSHLPALPRIRGLRVDGLTLVQGKRELVLEHLEAALRVRGRTIEVPLILTGLRSPGFRGDLSAELVVTPQALVLRYLRVYGEPLSLRARNLRWGERGLSGTLDELRHPAGEIRNAQITFRFPDSTLTLTLGSLRAQGQEIRDLEAVLSLEGKAVLRIQKLQGRHGEGFFSLQGRLTNLPGPPDSIGYHLNLHLKRFPLPSGYALTGKGTIRGKGAEGILRAAVARLDAPDLHLRNLSGVFRYTLEGVRIESLQVRSPWLKGEATGAFTWTQFHLQARADTLVLDSLPPRLRGALGGVATFTLALSRTDTLRAQLRGFVRGGRAGDLYRGDSVDVNLQIEEKRLLLHLWGQGGRFLNLPAGLASFSLDLRDVRSGFYELRVYTQEGDVLDTDGLVDLTDGLLLRSRTFSFILKGVPGELGTGVLLRIRGSQAQLQILDAQLFGGIASLDLVRDGDSLWMDFRAENLILSQLRGLTREAWEGEVTGTLCLWGTGERPELELGLRGSHLNLFAGGEQEADSLSLLLSYRDHLATVELNALGGGRLRGQGILPLLFQALPLKVAPLPDSTLALEVRAENFKAPFLNHWIQNALVLESPVINADLRVGGTLRVPQLFGQIGVQASEGLLIGTHTLLQNPSGEMRIKGGVVTSLRFSAKTPATYGMGKVEGTGTLRLEKFLPADLNLQVHLDHFPVYPMEYLEGELSGALQVVGTPPALDITGDLYVDNALVTLPLGARTGGGGGGKPSPIQYRIRLHGDRQLFLQNEFADVEFAMDLTVIKEDPVVRTISGEVQVLRGRVFYLDREFTITQGRMVFQNTSEINPDLQIEARAYVQDTLEVHLLVTGTLQKPEVALSAEPPLPEKDILALLIFGRPLSRLPQAVTDIRLLQERALNLAEGFLSRELRQRIRLTELEIRTGRAGQDPRFTVGLYLSENLYLRYTHDLLALEKDIFQLKYFLTNRTALYAERDKDGELFFGLEIRFRF